MIRNFHPVRISHPSLGRHTVVGDHSGPPSVQCRQARPERCESRRSFDNGPHAARRITIHENKVQRGSTRNLKTGLVEAAN
jgi:hypothetical protein